MQLEEFQLFEQTKALYKQLPAVIAGTFGVYVLTTMALWSSQDHTLLLGWHAAALVVLMLRWRSVRRYFRTRPAPQNMKPWLDRVVFWAVWTGLVWGVVPLLFVRQDDPMTALILAFVFPGYLAASASSLALSNRVFLAFSVPMASLFLLACVLQGGTLLYLVGLMIFVFMCIMVIFARNAEAMFRERAAFQYENQSLVRQLTQQKETAENAVEPFDDAFEFLMHGGSLPPAGRRAAPLCTPRLACRAWWSRSSVFGGVAWRSWRRRKSTTGLPVLPHGL